MRKFAFLSLLALLFGVIPAQPAAALTISISGTVTAAVGGAPIEGVAVAQRNGHDRCDWSLQPER